MFHLRKENFHFEGNIIEHSALVTAALWTKKPFVSVQHVLNKVAQIVDALPTEGRSKAFHVKKLSHLVTLSSKLILTYPIVVSHLGT